MNDTGPHWTSPSRVLSEIIGEDPEGLLRWAWKLGQEGTRLDEARNRGRQGGITVHAAAEAMATGQLRGELWSPCNPGAMQPKFRGAAEALNIWWRVRQPKVIATEAAVRSEQLRMSGRIDLVVQCDRDGCECQGKGLEIPDFKTGQTDYIKGHLQTGGFYPLLWHHDKHREGFVCRGVLVGLNTDGDCRPHEVDAAATPGAALDALSWYRQATSLRDVAGSAIRRDLTPRSQGV